jgi:hypothetical protein
MSLENMHLLLRCKIEKGILSLGIKVPVIKIKKSLHTYLLILEVPTTLLRLITETLSLF